MSSKEVKVPTREGMAVAIKEKSSEPWKIGYPWGDQRFYGSAPEVRAIMKRAIKDAGQEEEEK
jgi:hypothetical protein